MNDRTSYSSTYFQHLEALGVEVMPDLQAVVDEILEQTNWDAPETGLDCNNVGVIALIEAERSDDAMTRSLFIDMAVDAFEQGAGHPLCQVHLALLQRLLGDRNQSCDIAFNVMLNSLQPMGLAAQDLSMGLVYRPLVWRLAHQDRLGWLANMIQGQTTYSQALKIQRFSSS